LKDALQYLKTAVLREEVRKIPGKAKAQRFYNYPYEALKEALANAVYHRSYEDLNPIEVSVQSDRIEVLSYPGHSHLSITSNSRNPALLPGTIGIAEWVIFLRS